MSSLESRAQTPSGWDVQMHRSFSAFLRALALGSPSSRLFEADGVLATLVPATPERSFFNSVVYEHADALSASLLELSDAYDDAGIDAWTVWVPEQDTASAALLESAGHLLDATPEAMLLDLTSLEDPDPGDLEWSVGGSMDALARINDAAYAYAGYASGTFGRAIAETPAGTYRLYEARFDGDAASVLGTLDEGDDCAILWVATLPEAQGNGLSRRLLHLALADARERGCATSSLQASEAGAHVYRRLGFGELGALQMWERRG